MTIPLRNTIFEKIKEANSLTDVELYKSLTKDGLNLPEDKFNKLLLDLEILGLIKVAWFTKDERRIEVIVVEKEEDPIEKQNKEVNSLTDVELYKSLTKDGQNLPEDKFNKLLLDLEILGLIKVAWFTKDERRIEVIVIEKEEDPIEKQNKEVMEKDYEASFPGLDK